MRNLLFWQKHRSPDKGENNHWQSFVKKGVLKILTTKNEIANQKKTFATN